MASKTETPAWQPIETAPRDGRKFLAWDGWQICLASYTMGKFLATHGRSDHNDKTTDITQWHPLPEDPNE